MEEQLQNIQLESKNILIDVLKDTIDDKNKVVKRLQTLLSVISVLSLVLIVGMHIYNDWSFKAFMSQYDYENVSINQDIDADTEGNGNIYDVNKANITRN